MLRRDERGLAMGIVGFFAIIMIGALLYILFNPALAEVFTMTADQAQTSKSTDQINLAEQIWGGVLFYILFLATLYLIAKSVLETKAP